MVKRILHVVGAMNRGGVETWLMHILRRIDRAKFQMDFLVHTPNEGAFDSEIRGLGSRILPCIYPSSPIIYAYNMIRLLRDYGPYDVVHSHVHHFTGYVLWLARQVNVPIRIAHSHSDLSSVQAQANLLRRVYFKLTKRLIQHHATAGLAASRQAARSLFGRDWEADSRWRVLYYGIDLAAFRLPANINHIRAELGIAADSFVIGHVGNFREVKNHHFLLEVAAEVYKHEPRTRLLLVGDGPLRNQIEHWIKLKGLEGLVILAGWRSDIPRMLLAAMDIFVMPSLYEGLPVSLLEAQAAGLPCVVSDRITDEVIQDPALVRSVALECPPKIWAQEILTVRRTGVSSPNRQQMLELMVASPFNAETSTSELAKVYTDR